MQHKQLVSFVEACGDDELEMLEALVRSEREKRERQFFEAMRRGLAERMAL